MTSWSETPVWFQIIADEVCTPKELDALKLAAQGFGTQRSARMLGTSRGAVRHRLASAQRKIKEHPDYEKGMGWATTTIDL